MPINVETLPSGEILLEVPHGTETPTPAGLTPEGKRRWEEFIRTGRIVFTPPPRRR